MGYDPEPEIERYLEHLSEAAHDLPKPRRRELLSELEQHIRQALGQTPCANQDEMLALLERVGDPAEIAAAADDRTDLSPGRRQTFASLRKHPLRTMVALVALVVIVLAVGAAVWTQSYQPLAFAPADVLTADSVNTYGENDHGALVGYNEYGHPFFGVTIQNTGPFTVRVLGNARYGAALPVFEAWSSRLLMARGTFVQEVARGPSKVPVRDTNGHVVHVRVWKREPLEPFRPVDLAPGQVVMLLWIGVWHDCHDKAISVGTTTPPRSLPIRYSFLWDTTTAHIPLPGGLTIAPPGHNALTGCNHPSIAAVRKAATPGVPHDLNSLTG